MSKPEHKVIYNQDFYELFYELFTGEFPCNIEKPINPEHVDHMVDEVADGGADVFLVNPNSQKVNYPSKVWETYWDNEEFRGTRLGLSKVFGKVEELAQQCDYLEQALARCRQRGIVPGVSIRMNDMHGFGEWPKSPMFSRFYMEHPEWQLDGRHPARGYASRALNYAIPQVRDHYMSLIREIASEYDIEVLELDFSRFQAYFYRDNIQQHCATMTKFIAEVRSAVDATGQEIALMPRIAATPGGALGLGFDVQAWAQQGIIDGITVSEFLSTGWELPIAQFRSLVGPDVAVYAGTDAEAFTWEGLNQQQLALDAELLRGFAAGYLASGADGVNLFNFFIPRQKRQPQEPLFNVLAQMGDLESLRSKERRHAITSGFQIAEFDLPRQVPVELSPGQSRKFGMTLAGEGPGVQGSLLIIFDGTAHSDDLWLYLNDQPIGCAAQVVEGEQGTFQSQVATFDLPQGAVRDGTNEVIVRCENTTIRIVGLEVRFAAK